MDRSTNVHILYRWGKMTLIHVYFFRRAMRFAKFTRTSCHFILQLIQKVLLLSTYKLKQRLRGTFVTLVFSSGQYGIFDECI